VLLEAEGDPAAIDALLARLAAEAPSLAAVERIATERVPATGSWGFAIVESERHGAPSALVSPDTATCDDCLRELFRSRRPPPSLPLRQLHELRAAVHDRTRRAVRPAADDDGRLQHVPGLPGRVRRPRRPPLPRPAKRLRGVRPPAATARSCGRRAGWRPAGRDGRCAARRADRRGQGDRRLPLGVRGRRRGGGGGAASSQAARGQAVRADGAEPGRGRGARYGERGRHGSAHRSRAADRGRPSPPGRAGGGRRRPAGRAISA
jgi:hypothetical protein